MAHILREVAYLNQIDEKQLWSRQLQTLSQEAIFERNQHPDKVIDPSYWLTRLDHLLNQSVEHLKDDFRRLKNGLIKYRDYVLKFLGNLETPPHNNASERGIRKLKIKQKISVTFRSDQGADAFITLHSITDNVWKNKQSPFDESSPFFNDNHPALPLAE